MSRPDVIPPAFTCVAGNAIGPKQDTSVSAEVNELMSVIAGKDGGGVTELNAVHPNKKAFKLCKAFIDAGMTHVTKDIDPCIPWPAVVQAFILVGNVTEVNNLLVK